MPDDSQPFTEKELEALVREHGKPVREGFENDVLRKVRSLQRETERTVTSDSKSDRLKELEDAAGSTELEAPEQDLEM